MSKKKLVLCACGAVVFFVGVGAIALNSLVDRQMIIKQLSDTIEKQTGRILSVNKVKIQFFPWPEVQAFGIALSNSPYTQHKYILKADKLQASINILPLWNCNIRFSNFHLSNVKIYLERNSLGQFNWTNDNVALDKATQNIMKNNSSTSHIKWNVEFNNIILDNVEYWYLDQLTHKNIHIHFNTAELSQIEDNKLRFNFVGIKHQTKFLISGRINSNITDVTTNLFTNTQNFLSKPFKLQLNLAEYIHEQKVGNFRISGNIKNPLNFRGYDLTIRGTILNLSDINRFFPHANLPSIYNITLNTAVEDNALDTESKAKPKIKLLQLHTDSIQNLPFLPKVHIDKTQIIANQLDEKINTQITGKIDEESFNWTGEVGTLNSFYNLIFSKSSKPIRIKGIFNSQNLTADLDGTVGGSKPSLYSKINIIFFQYFFEKFGNIAAKDVFYKGKISVPFVVQNQNLKALYDNLIQDISFKGELSSSFLKLNQFEFQKSKTDLEWNKNKLTLTALQLINKENIMRGYVEYIQKGQFFSLLLKIDHSIVPMKWIEIFFNLPKLYTGDVEVVGNLYGKGENRQLLFHNLEGHVGLSGVNGKIDINGLRHFVGKSLSNIPMKTPLMAQCLAIHANISDHNLIFDTLTLQTKQFALNGRGSVNIANDTIDLHLLPDINLGSVNASIPIRITGRLSRPYANFDINKNKVYMLNINPVNKSMALKNYCVDALTKAREYSDKSK